MEVLFNRPQVSNLSDALTCFAEIVTDFFSVISRKQEMSHFCISLTISRGESMITRQMTQFLHLIIELYLLIYFIFLFHLHFVPVYKIQIYKAKMTLSGLLTQISFFYITFVIFQYITCCVPIWPQSHVLICVRFFITKCGSFITKYVRYYKICRFYYQIRKLLQNTIIITKMRQYMQLYTKIAFFCLV